MISNAKLYGKSVFSFIRNFQTVFKKVAVSCIPATNEGVPVAPPSHWHLISMEFWILAVLIGVQR